MPLRGSAMWALHSIPGLGFRVEVLGFRVEVLGFRVEVLGFRGFRV